MPRPSETEGALSAGGIHDHVRAMDAAAWVMIGLLFFLMLCLAYAAWRLYRRSSAKSPLDGLESSDEGSQEGSPRKPDWEKDSDWWKK